jgi:hypothetical protein
MNNPIPAHVKRADGLGGVAPSIFSQFDQYARTLAECRHPQIAALWALMKSLQKGLPQEWMRDL